MPTLGAGEAATARPYDEQPEAEAGGLPGAERSHARIREARRAARPGRASCILARLEGRHRTGGNALRAAVLGANDGLVSNLSLVMGVAGAEVSEHTILFTGLAGLVAGACSMAIGEWLSVHQLARAEPAADRDRSGGTGGMPGGRKRKSSP